MELRQVEIKEVYDHPENPRTRYREWIIDKIATELRGLGYYPKEHALKLYNRKGKLTIISGHHRKRAVMAAKMETVWAWIDDDITEDEAFMQLATSNEQSEMDGIEKALHVYRWCVPGSAGRGKSGQERSTVDYAERMRISQPMVVELRKAGEFAATTKSIAQAIDFSPSPKLYYELSKAPEGTWQILRSTVEDLAATSGEEKDFKTWTVSEAKKVVKLINDTITLIPEWWPILPHEVAVMAIDSKGKLEQLTAMLKKVHVITDQLKTVSLYTHPVDNAREERKDIDGREHMVVDPVEIEFDQETAFIERFLEISDYPTLVQIERIYDEILVYCRENNENRVKYFPVLTEEEHAAKLEEDMRKARLAKIDLLEPEIHVGESLSTLRTMRDETVDFVCIDPPYNVKKAVWDDQGDYYEFKSWIAPYITEAKRIVSEKGCIAIFGASQTIWCVQMALVEAGLFYQNKIDIVYSQGGNNGNVLMQRRDELLVFSKVKVPWFNADAVKEMREEENIRVYGGKVYDQKNIGDTWSANPVDDQSPERTEHPTQKSVALMKKILSIFCPEGGTILDFFGGSGSTSVAAINLGMRSVYIEKNSDYADIARTRFENALASSEMK